MSLLQQADESLNFEEQILEAAKSITAAAGALVKAATAAQRELVATGRVRIHLIKDIIFFLLFFYLLYLCFQITKGVYNRSLCIVLSLCVLFNSIRLVDLDILSIIILSWLAPFKYVHKTWFG